jgi:peroxiredoxin Q/BCP
MSLPKAGSAAPAFAAQDESGAKVTLAELKGSWVVLFFYPKDDTPG